MEDKFVPHLEVRIGPVLGTDESESIVELIKPRYSHDSKFTPNLTVADYEAIVGQLRLLADEIEMEHTAIRR